MSPPRGANPPRRVQARAAALTGVVVAWAVVTAGVPAVRAQGDATATPAAARSAAAALLKAGQPREAATTLVAAGERAGGVDGGALRLEAAAAYAGARAWAEASQVARALESDRTAALGARVAAGQLAAGIYWLEELRAGARAGRDALEAAAATPATDATSVPARAAALATSGPALLARLTATEGRLRAARAKLAELTAADDPMVLELDKMLLEFDALRAPAALAAQQLGVLRRALSARAATTKKLGVAIGKLDKAIGAAESALAKAGPKPAGIARALQAASSRAARPFDDVARARVAISDEALSAVIATIEQALAGVDAVVGAVELVLDG